YDDIEKVCGHLIKNIPMQRLDRCEHVFTALRALAVDVKLAERAVAEDVTKLREALLQNLLAMSYVEEAQGTGCQFESLVVECGNDRLARPGRGYHEVPVPTVPSPFDVQSLEDLSLVRIGNHVERDKRDLLPIRSPDCGVKTIAVALGIEGF